MRHYRQIARMVVTTAALCPAAAMAQWSGPPMRINDLLIASAARIARAPASSDRAKPHSIPFSNIGSSADHFDLARFAAHTTNFAIGSVDLRLSASRASNGADETVRGLDADRWSSKNIGLSAIVSLTSNLSLIIGGDYARMTRRLRVVEVNPYRLSTRMARMGMALDFGDERRLSLDYLSVARSSRHDGLTRLAETLGGAPLTGQGPELAFSSMSSAERGGMDWRLAFSAMQRPTADLGLIDPANLRSDMRAMASLRFHL